MSIGTAGVCMPKTDRTQRGRQIRGYSAQKYSLCWNICCWKSENQSVSGVTTFLAHVVQHVSLSEMIRLLIVECWSTPLQWLCEVTGYWQELEHTVVYADPEHPKHAQWVTCPVSMLAIQELGCFQLPGIVYKSLQHGAVHYHAATWGDGRGWMAQEWAS